MTAAIALPAGLVSRPATMADCEAAARLFNRCDGPIAGPTWHTPEETRIVWSSPDLDLERDTIVVCTRGGTMVGYEQLMSEAPHVRLRAFGRVDPAFEGRGIGSTLFAWAERRVEARIAMAPDDALVRLQGWCFAGHAPSQRLLAERGLRVVRHSLNMAMPLDERHETAVVQWPAGVELRPYEPSHFRALYLAHHDAFRDHAGIGRVDVETGYERFRHYFDVDPGHDPSLWFLAWAGDEVAGYIICRPESFEDPDLAWVDDLGVRRVWRRRGLASALLRHAFAALRVRGRPGVGLSVDAQSLTGATRLYEKVGMHVTLTFQIHERELRAGVDYETTKLEA